MNASELRKLETEWNARLKADGLAPIVDRERLGGRRSVSLTAVGEIADRSDSSVLDVDATSSQLHRLGAIRSVRTERSVRTDVESLTSVVPVSDDDAYLVWLIDRSGLALTTDQRRARDYLAGFRTTTSTESTTTLDEIPVSLLRMVPTSAPTAQTHADRFRSVPSSCLAWNADGSRLIVDVQDPLASTPTSSEANCRLVDIGSTQPDAIDVAWREWVRESGKVKTSARLSTGERVKLNGAVRTVNGAARKLSGDKAARAEKREATCVETMAHYLTLLPVKQTGLRRSFTALTPEAQERVLEACKLPRPLWVSASVASETHLSPYIDA